MQQLTQSGSDQTLCQVSTMSNDENSFNESSGSPGPTPELRIITKAPNRSSHGKQTSVKLMVVAAIETSAERKGTSVQAIKKYISVNYDVDIVKLNPHLIKFFHTAVEDAILVQVSGKGATGRFKLAPVQKEKNVIKPKKSIQPEKALKRLNGKTSKARKDPTATAISPIVSKSKKQAHQLHKVVKETKKTAKSPATTKKRDFPKSPAATKPRKLLPNRKPASPKCQKTPHGPKKRVRKELNLTVVVSKSTKKSSKGTRAKKNKTKDLPVVEPQNAASDVSEAEDTVFSRSPNDTTLPTTLDFSFKCDLLDSTLTSMVPSALSLKTKGSNVNSRKKNAKQPK